MCILFCVETLIDRGSTAASTNNDHNFYRVDSLLQIHAIHNLLSIDGTVTLDEKQNYQTELNALEAKYLEKNVNLVKNYQIEQEKWQQKVEELENKFQENAYQWWIDVLYNESSVSSQLLMKISVEIENSYGHEKMTRIKDG